MSNQKITLPCVILAGGKSSRMGQDKALLPFNQSNSLAQHMYSTMSQIFENVYISTKENKFDFDANLILDEGDVYAPTIALEAILKRFNGHVFIVAVDMPFVSKETITTLYQHLKNENIVIAKESDTLHNMCGFYHTALLPTLQKAISNEQHALYRLLKSFQANYIEIGESRSFINLNTPGEYQKALQ
jgi:molybdenum cofactor guanylyltransferase